MLVRDGRAGICDSGSPMDKLTFMLGADASTAVTNEGELRNETLAIVFYM